MTVVQEVHVGDVGTVFDITLKDGDSVVDLSAATAIVAWLRDPDRVTTAKTASLITTGADGRVSYVSDEGDLDQAGLWGLQFVVTFPDGVWHSTIWHFTVYENLPDPA